MPALYGEHMPGPTKLLIGIGHLLLTWSLWVGPLVIGLSVVRSAWITALLVIVFWPVAWKLTRPLQRRR